MRIVGIGGAVIKTAWEEIKGVAQRGLIDVLIHNGGSLFHDFQRAIDPRLGNEHSYPLSQLMEDYSVNEPVAKMVWSWVKIKEKTPEGSLTRIFQDQERDILMFTIPGADFWHLFSDDWTPLAVQMQRDFRHLCEMMKQGPFHFICMGSAVIMPEVFIKAVAVAKPKDFKADVVDFLEIYRPRTRVACYGQYHHMTHKEYLDLVLTGNFWMNP